MMVLGLINPGFAVAGAAMVAIPIIIHILNRRRYRIQQWAAMKFLLEAMRRNRRRLQFEQWILLAARCLALLLLGLALARPTGCADSSLASFAQRAGLHVIVIDNSYSMAYEADRPDAKTHFDQAKKVAKQIVDQLSGGGESVAIITTSRPATAVIARPSYDLAAVTSAIDRIPQGAGATDLAGALRMTQSLGEEFERLPALTLHVITDATASAFRGESANELANLGPTLAQRFRVIHYDLGKGGQWNQAVTSLASARGLVRQGFPNDFAAVVRGYGPSHDARLLWKLDEQPLPGGATLRPEPATEPSIQSGVQFGEGGLHVISATLAGDDRLQIDNTRWRVVDVASELKVLLVEGKRGIGPLAGSAAFLRLALAPPAEGEAAPTSYLAPEVISDLELGDRVLTDYRAIFLADVAGITATVADRLKIFVEQGGTLIVFGGEQIDRDSYNANLAPRRLMPGMLVKRVTRPDGGRPFTFDFRPAGAVHPFLGAFRGLANSGLDTAEVIEYWQIEPLTDGSVQRVLDYLPNAGQPADPAITVHGVGEGLVVFISTTANAEWTTFPAKPAYLTLVHELVSSAVRGSERWLNLEVGDVLEVPSSIGITQQPTLTDAKVEQITLEQATGADGRAIYRSPPLTEPGLYRLATGARVIPVVVNVPDDEADITHLDENALKAALGGIEMDFAGDSVPQAAVAARTGNDYGWIILLSLLVLLGLECFMAMRFGHYRKSG